MRKIRSNPAAEIGSQPVGTVTVDGSRIFIMAFDLRPL